MLRCHRVISDCKPVNSKAGRHSCHCGINSGKDRGVDPLFHRSMFSKFSPTLRQVFALSLLGLLLSLALLFYLVFAGSERTIQESSERLRDRASREMVNRVTDYLEEAPMAVSQFEREIQYGLVNTGKVDSIHDGLMSLLLANENISEASFTYATSTGTNQAGDTQIDRSTSGEATVFRSNGRFVSRRTWFDGKQFVSQTTDLAGGS